MSKERAIPLPRLLDENMREVCRLHPSAFSTVVKLTPLSTASITLPEGEPVLVPRQWVEIFGTYGKLGIYRVSKPRRAYGQQQQATLEHGIATLGDDVTPKETKLTGSVKKIIGDLLGYQSKKRWELGEAPSSGEYTLEVDRTNLLQAVMDLLKQAPEYQLTFDQTKTPWKVSVTALSTEPLCECRIGRNASDVKEYIDESSLLTRVYSDVLPGGHMDGPTIQKWGVVADDLGVADDADREKAEAYARELLESRKDPAISLEVDGLYLSSITGETIDALRVGKICRVALPRYGMTAKERIIEARFPDLLNFPERVTLTLSSQPKDTSSALADLRRNENSLTNTAIDHGESIRAHGGSISQLNGEFEKTYKYAEIVDGKLTEFENYVGIQLDEVNAEIRLKASQTAMDEMGERMSAAEININGAEAAIELKASQEDVDKLGTRVSTAEATLTVQAGEISSKVSKNGVISSINQTAEAIKIQASKINLSGYVTASQLSASIADVTITQSSTVACNTLETNSLIAGYFTLGGDYISKKSKTVQTGIPDFTKATITLANGNSIGVVTGWADAPSSMRSTLYYLSNE